MRVAIIGAGLAGCALALFLKRAGAEPVIYEAGAEIAPAASGNPAGLYNPRFTAEFGAEAEFYSAAFALALEIFPGLGDVGWRACGALHLITDEKKEKRFSQTVRNWPAPEMRLVDAREASEIAGVEIAHDALYLPRSGLVSPRTLCTAYAADVEILFNAPVSSLPPADAVVLACGMGVAGFFPDLALRAVRGQVSFVKASSRSAELKTNICYGGYISAPVEGVHMAGSTFQRWLDHTDILPEDNADNLAKLERAVPALAGLEIAGARAAIRTTSPDHFPVAGQAGENSYVSAAHGSHGILSTLMTARILTDMILKQPPRVSQRVIERLSPKRIAGSSFR